MVFGKNLPALQLAIVAAVLIPGGVSILHFTAHSNSGSMVAVVFGMGNGLLSVVVGTLPLSILLGTDGYGRLQGTRWPPKWPSRP